MEREAWINDFDERQRKEIRFSVLYAHDFAHGTEGHNSKLIIAKMAALLDRYQMRIDELKYPRHTEPERP